MAERKLTALLERLDLPYESRREFKASALHWPDVVWFEKRLPDALRPEGLPGIPVVGFEIESAANLQSIKAAINNLEELKPAVGCIIIPADVSGKPRTIEREEYGQTFGEAVRYLASRSPLFIAVLTEEDLDAMMRHSNTAVLLPQAATPLLPSTRGRRDYVSGAP